MTAATQALARVSRRSAALGGDDDTSWVIVVARRLVIVREGITARDEGLCSARLATPPSMRLKLHTARAESDLPSVVFVPQRRA